MAKIKLFYRHKVAPFFLSFPQSRKDLPFRLLKQTIFYTQIFTSLRNFPVHFFIDKSIFQAKMLLGGET